MDALVSSSSPIHFYDTDRHVIVCGVLGFADRSTKHERAVTCTACIVLLRDRRESRRDGSPTPLAPVEGSVA